MKNSNHKSVVGGGGNSIRVPAANINGTPFEKVCFIFCLVTPELASDWLKHNRKNRRLKETTLEAYAMDMRNGAWLTTHQGIAFDAADNLTDGQHRLQGIVRSKRPVLLLISTGWPVESSKRKTMDAVDRGVNRSLADQLHLQHDIVPRDALRVVQICNSTQATSVWAQISGGGLSMFHFKSDGGNFYNCVTWDGINEGSMTISIAKLPKLRISLLTETIEGVVYNYTYAAYASGGVTISYTRSTTGGVNQTDKVTPPYLLDDVLFATGMSTGLVDSSDNPITWQEISERAWGKQ
jgi:hypothetical protein